MPGLQRLQFLLDPRLRVNLDLNGARDNHPFFAQVTEQFWRESNARHPKFPLLKAFRYGIAMCVFPPSFDEYFALVNPAARRNFKKAQREGFEFARINFNDHLEDIAAIRRSSPVRQGAMPESYLRGEVQPCADPPSQTNRHDYPYFGVLKDGRLLAYAGCMVSGEVMLIQHILGHADFQNFGIVPMMIIKMAQYCLERYPRVLYYGYGSYYGASPEMRRFKSKFLFTPHIVDWRLDDDRPSPAQPRPLPPIGPPPDGAANYQNVYRLVNPRPMAQVARPNLGFAVLRGFGSGLVGLGYLKRLHGPAGALKSLLKVCTARRFFYLALEDDEVVSTGWCTKAPCKHYQIEPQAVVIGPIWTDPGQRRRGLATYALKNAINECVQNGFQLIYIDTSRDNIGAQRVFANCGFGEPVQRYPR